MRRDFVEDRCAEESVQCLQNLTVALRTPLVQIGVVVQINLSELLEGDIGLSADAVTTVENP
jgi:hypothetical protein